MRRSRRIGTLYDARVGAGLTVALRRARVAIQAARGGHSTPQQELAADWKVVEESEKVDVPML